MHRRYDQRHDKAEARKCKLTSRIRHPPLAVSGRLSWFGLRVGGSSTFVVRPQLMKPLLEARFRRRVWYLLALIATIAVGLASRRFSQVFPAFVGKYPGDVLWSLMVFIGLGAIFNKASSVQLAFGALIFSYGIEALKLCQTPWLVSARHSSIGHLIFGSVFSWQNLVAYTIGVLMGLMVEVLFVANLRASRGRNAAYPGGGP